jgi:hypothetical protein
MRKSAKDGTPGPLACDACKVPQSRLESRTASHELSRPSNILPEDFLNIMAFNAAM